MYLGLVKVQQWVGLINEIRKVNSSMVLKSNNCYQRNGLFKRYPKKSPQ